MTGTRAPYAQPRFPTLRASVNWRIELWSLRQRWLRQDGMQRAWAAVFAIILYLGLCVWHLPAQLNPVVVESYEALANQSRMGLLSDDTWSMIVYADRAELDALPVSVPTTRSMASTTMGFTAASSPYHHHFYALSWLRTTLWLVSVWFPGAFLVVALLFRSEPRSSALQIVVWTLGRMVYEYVVPGMLVEELVVTPIAIISTADEAVEIVRVPNQLESMWALGCLLWTHVLVLHVHSHIAGDSGRLRCYRAAMWILYLTVVGVTGWILCASGICTFEWMLMHWLMACIVALSFGPWLFRMFSVLRRYAQHSLRQRYYRSGTIWRTELGGSKKSKRNGAGATPEETSLNDYLEDESLASEAGDVDGTRSTSRLAAMCRNAILAPFSSASRKATKRPIVEIEERTPTVR